MYHIIVCGRQDEVQTLSEMCDEIMKEKSIAGSVSVTSEPQKLLRLGRKEGERIGMVLLDVEGDGMLTASKLRDMHPELSIALYSSDMAHAFEGYNLHACGFLLKPAEREKLCEIITRDYEIRFRKSHLLVGEQMVRLNRIRYLEIAGKKVAVHLNNGDTLYLNGKLSDIALSLSSAEGKDRFIRCHQSYLVNLRYVESVRRYQLTMLDGEELPISKAYTQDFQQAFLEFAN